MKINYTLKLAVEVDEGELKGLTPTQYLQEQIEEDPELLFSQSELVSHKIGKVEREEADLDEDEDDDGLSEVDEEDMGSFE